MSGLDPILAAARDWKGERLFYDEDEHPATARYRRELIVLKTMPETPNRDEAIAYVEQRLGDFNAVERRAQREYLEHARRRAS